MWVGTLGAGNALEFPTVFGFFFYKEVTEAIAKIPVSFLEIAPLRYSQQCFK